MTKEVKDFEHFMKNVNEISDLVKELNSSDVTSHRRAVEKADSYLAALKEEEPCKTVLNRTSINTDPSQRTMVLQRDPSLSSEHFMKSMEQDAEARWERRRVKVEKANGLREKGNKAYSLGEYEMAVKLYSDGINELQDMETLYTNRAQAYIKLEKYKEAISDCELALKCNEKCVKAYLHMGRAQLAAKNYNESRMCYQKILEIEPGREKMVKEYQTKVDLEEERVCQESEAWEEFEKGGEEAKTVPELLNRLDRPEQVPFYYCGGLSLLSQTITGRTGQTLFRLHNGFNIIQANDTVRSCLLQNLKAQCTEELCLSVLNLWRVICDGNDENQKMLMSCPFFQNYILDLLMWGTAVQRECIALLCLYSRTPRGRSLAIDNLNMPVLVENLMVSISTQNLVETTVLTVLENFAKENRFCMQLKGQFTTTVMLPFSNLLRNITECNRHIFPSLISTVDLMIVNHAHIRKDVSSCHEFWPAFLIAMEQCIRCEHREVLYPLLGMMINLLSVSNSAPQAQHVVLISDRCMGLLTDPDGGILTRATGLLSALLPRSAGATEDAVCGGVTGTMRKLLKGSGKITTKYVIKTLAVCTATSQTAREEWVKCDKRFHILKKLLGPGNDEVVTGNAALCLGHCLEVQGAASCLLGTDIVHILLRHAAGNATGSAVQQNAAIALGKLCRAEPRHLAKLRELHGLEILHSCMKLIV